MRDARIDAAVQASQPNRGPQGWLPPGRLSEPPTGALAAFAGPLEGARVNGTDPAVSARQQRFMGLCAADPGRATKACPPRAVAREFARKARR